MLASVVLLATVLLLCAAVLLLATEGVILATVIGTLGDCQSALSFFITVVSQRERETEHEREWRKILFPVL